MKDPAQSKSLTRELLLAQLPSATWTVDSDLRVTSWNGGDLMSSEKFQGMITGRPLSEVYRANGIDPNSLEMHKQALEGISSDFVMNISERDFMVNLYPLRGGGDQIIGVVGVALEQTAGAHRAERLLRKAAFDRVLSTFFAHTVRHQFDEGFYQRLIEAALEMVPGAQAGSFWLPAAVDQFKAVAVVGLGRDAFEGLALTAEELSRTVAGLDSSDGLVDLTPGSAARATLSVPVNVNREAGAFLYIHSFEAVEAFDEDAHEFMQLFANELGALFQHAELRRTLREERHSLEGLLQAYKALAEFGAEIETIHDTDELIEHGMKRLLEAFQFDSAVFTEVRGDFLYYTRVLGDDTEEVASIVEAPQPLGAGINGRVAVSGELMYVEDYTSWPSGYEPYAATGVLSMLALPIRRNGRVQHTLAFATINRRVSIDENMVRIASGFAKRLENAFERADHLEEIKSTREATFRSLGIALEYRDLETHGHTDRVVKLSRQFASVLSLSRERGQALAWGAYLHDLGKVAVPDAILLKPAQLTEEEFAVIRKHTVYGAEMVRDIPFLPAETRQIVRSHHERWDGRGYPDQLAGDDIPLLARMFSLVDVYDALLSERPYKRAWTHEEAVAELKKQAGRQFDPALTRHFVEMIQQFFT